MSRKITIIGAGSVGATMAYTLSLETLATEIVRRYADMAAKTGRKQLILTCLEDKVSMYRKMGFLDRNMANSTWGGEAWHEMAMDLGPRPELHR